MKHSHRTRGARPSPMGRSRLVLAGLLVAGAVACNTSSLVDIQNPDIISGTVARDTANITSVRNGALYEFARAYSGPGSTNSTPGIVGISGLMADELWYSSTFTGMQDIDRRTITNDNTNLLPVYQYLHRARNTAEQAARQYASTSQANTEDHAMLTNLAGYTYVMFAENFCSGVPFSSTGFGGELTFGPAYTTQAMLDTALARFNSALTQAATAGSATQQNLARLGRARALLDRGDFAGAAAQAAQVPSGFEYAVEYSENTTGQNNGVYYNINSERRTSAATGEGVNGIVFFRRGPRNLGSATTNTIDPRAPADSLGFGIGGQIPLYRQNKYPSLGSPIVLASGTEARLIEAEAALAKGASPAYLVIVNQLRADYGLAPLVDPLTADARVRQFFSERAFFLWLTGHRLSDLRRMVRQYGYTQAQVFPTTQTITGAPYGSDVNFPIPQQEQNNPQFANGQCIDRGA
jgi:starch-binding outer membrane protein, SusD/RagB family